MIDINKLRKLAKAATPGRGWYVELGDYIYGEKDVTDGEEWQPVIVSTEDGEPVNFEGSVAAFIAAANPTAMIELLDRLEAAENDALEQARLNGIGAEKELALMAKLEAAAKERDTYKAAYNEWIAKTEWVQDEITRGKLPAKCLGMHRADGIKAEIDALRAALQHETDCVEAAKAEIAAMKQQEPAAFALYSGCARKAVYLSEIEACEQRDRRQLTADLGGSLEAYRVVPLGVLPGAQNVPSFADAYQGAMEEAAIWKKRALEAEDMNRKFIAEINGPTHMGEPAPSVHDVPAKNLKPVIDWLRNGCDPQEAAKELEILIAAAPEAKP